MLQLADYKKGQSLVEYALILVLIVIVVLVIFVQFSPLIGGIFSSIYSKLPGTT